MSTETPLQDRVLFTLKSTDEALRFDEVQAATDPDSPDDLENALDDLQRDVSIQ